MAGITDDDLTRRWSLASVDGAEALRAPGTEHRLRCAVQLCTLCITGPPQLVVAEEQKGNRRRWQTVEPTNKTPRLVQRHLDAASMFGACSAKLIWASGHAAAS